jgi:hypothetical protein
MGVNFRPRPIFFRDMLEISFVVKMGAEEISETSDFNSTYTRLIGGKESITNEG